MSRNLRVVSEYRSDSAAGAVAPNPRKPKPFVSPTARKQTGRRYGPAPRVEAPKHAYTAPMSDGRRADIYGLSIVEVMVDGKPVQRPTGGTARQRRQWTRMHRRNLGRGAA